MKLAASAVTAALLALSCAVSHADGDAPDVDGFLAAHPEIAQAIVWEMEPAPVPTLTATPTPTKTPTPIPTATVTAKPRPTATLKAFLPRPTATPKIVWVPGFPIPTATATAKPSWSPSLFPPGGFPVAEPTQTQASGPTVTPTPVATVTPGSPVAAAWSQWPEARKQKLRDDFAHYTSWLATGMPLYEAWAAGGFAAEPDGFASHFDPEIDADPAPAVYPPTNLQWGFPNGSNRDVYPSEQAFALYVKNVAFLLALEVGGYVPWSLLEIDAQGLGQLLDGRTTFAYVAAGASPYGLIKSAGHLLTNTVIPGPPLMVFSHLARNGLIGTSRRDTIELLLAWSNPFIHTWSGNVASGASLLWVLFQYEGRPPVTRMMNGTLMTEKVGYTFYPEREHFVGGCGGYSGFARQMLRPAGIPVETVVPDHHTPHFMSEGLYLSHGDDAYGNSPEVPAGDLLIDQAQFDAWFVTDPNPAHNTGRGAAELEIQYVGAKAVKRRCQDLWNIEWNGLSPDHGASSVYLAAFATLYTVAELEALQLWEKLDAKIASIPGGCQTVLNP